MYTQLSVAKAIVKRATAMIEVIVAKLRVTAEQGIFWPKEFRGNTKNGHRKNFSLEERRGE